MKRDKTKYGYATPHERKAASRRIRNNLRYSYRGTFARLAREGHSVTKIRRFFNYTYVPPGKGLDKDYGYQGLSDKHMMSAEQVDIETKMAKARTLYEARKEARRMGKEMRRKMADSFLRGWQDG